MSLIYLKAVLEEALRFFAQVEVRIQPERLKKLDQVSLTMGRSGIRYHLFDKQQFSAFTSVYIYAPSLLMSDQHSVSADAQSPGIGI